MARLCILGFGKMGKAVLAESRNFPIFDGVTIVDARETSVTEKIIRPDEFATIADDFDVLADFSSASSNDLLVQAAKAGKKIVVGTTGRTSEQDAGLALAVKAGNSSAVVAPNFSTGVAVLIAIAKKASSLLPGYDKEIVEEHHSQKKDAPSGTAKRLASAAGVTSDRIHAVRSGQIFGEHEIIFAGNNEVVRLRHSALSRQCFARGALEAAAWVSGKNDGKVHDFAEVLGIDG